MIFKLLAAFLLLITGIWSLGCSQDPASPEPVEIGALEKQLVQSDNTFGLKLFKEIVADETGSNVFISPLSVSMALGMTLNGAAAKTQADMEATLELSGLTTEQINTSYQKIIQNLSNLDPRVTFQIANSIWYRNTYTFKNGFLDDNHDYFDARIEALDFDDQGSVDTINNWVRNNTNERIPKIIDGLDADLVMLLINAIYFKGDWTSEFKKSNTREADFFPTSSQALKVKMMNKQEDYAYYEDASLQAIDLPYGDEAFSLSVVLPKQGKNIDELIAGLDDTVWQAWTGNYRSQEIDLYLPKFKMEYEKTLNEILTSLGMGVAFSRAEADFSRMYEGPNRLFISKVKHKTFVQVDEEGTEAAAATSVGITVTSIPMVITMRVDRPFLFAIREKNSGAVLFIGRIEKPEFD